MSNHCKIEFYFKFEDMKKLLDENEGAKGIIIKQEIKPRKNADSNGFTYTTTITAHAKGPAAKGVAVEDETNATSGEPIEWYPYPPGCSSEN